MRSQPRAEGLREREVGPVVGVEGEVGDLEPRPKRRPRGRTRGPRPSRRRRHRQVRPHVERYLVVECVKFLPAARQGVERQPDPPPCPLDAAAELALFFYCEAQRTLPEPREAFSSPAVAIIVPQRAPRCKPLSTAWLIDVLRVEAEHGREGRDERGEAIEVGKRRRRSERSRRWFWFWFRCFVFYFLFFLFLLESSSISGSILGSRRHRKSVGIFSGIGFRFRPRRGRERKHRYPLSSSASFCCSPLLAVAGPESVVLVPAARLERARAAGEAAQEGRWNVVGRGRGKERGWQGQREAGQMLSLDLINLFFFSLSIPSPIPISLTVDVSTSVERCLLGWRRRRSEVG